ncbi:PAS domain S-box protein [Floridanema evergladense]|uniref:histidine kinase n=1 Tax=Floridaenema evergladense BLCC-F167 TaxID=3153639 RepID=A0ABV4WEA3_9CYAN
MKRQIKAQNSVIKVPLHWVLIVPFVLQTVGAVGLVGYFSYRSGQEAVEDLAKRLLAQVSERVSDRLDRYLQTPQHIVKTNFLAVKQGNLKINNFEQLRQNFWQQMNFNPLLPYVSFWSEQGESIAYLRFLTQEERDFANKVTGKNLILGKNYLLRINKRNPTQRLYYTVDDLQGKPKKQIYSAVDIDFRQLPWYRQAKAARKQIWSSVFLNRILPFLQLQAVTPIYDDAGKFQGVFNALYLLSDISNFLNKEDFSPSGQVFILERSGNLIATSTLEKLYVKSAKGKPKRLSALNSQNTKTREINQQLIKRFGSFANLKNIKQLNLVANNQQHFVQVTPYRDQYGLDWLIVVVVPHSDFMSQINENVWRTIWLCGLTFLGTIILGIISAYYIIKPIRKLSQSSQELAAGNWQNFKLEDSLIQEISVLTESFNRTAQQLQQSFEQIKTALQESEARFTKVFRTSPDPISINELGDGGKYIEVNDSFLQFSQYSREEVIGKTPEELNISADLQQNLILLEQLQKYGRIEGFEFHYRTKFGKSGISLLSIELVELEGQQRVLTIAKDITDRKQLELALQASKTQLNDVLNSAIAAISSFRVTTDKNWQINYISAGCELISGYTSSELQADKNIWVLQIFPGDWEAIESQVYTDIFNQQTGTYEYRFYHKNGRLLWISQTNTSRWDENLNCWIVTAVSLDITDRKKVEAALQESEQTNRALVQSIPDLLIRMSRDGTYLDIRNSEEVKLFNALKVQPGAKVFDLLPPEIAQERFALIQNTLTTGQIQIQEYTLEIAGEINYEEARIVPCGVDDVLLIVRDVSDRKRMEAALRESEERFRRAFDDAAIGMALVALDGRFLQVNRAICEITGYSEVEILGSFFQNITHPDDLEADLEYVRQVLAGERRTFQMEKRYIHKSGHFVWCVLSVSIVKDRQGNSLYFVSQIQDISERRKIDKIKDEFISIVSHELRTPLTAIRGSLGILETGVLDDRPEKAKYMLKLAVKNSERLVQLVNDILDLERLQSGKVQLVTENCQVEDLMQQAVESVQAIAQQVQINIKVTPLAAEILASTDAIIQALTNLLSNAIKFSPPHSTIWLSAELRPGKPQTEENQNGDRSPHILFQVKDQGRGIPADKLETIFGRFQQVDISDSRQKGGTGLGLAICKSIVQQHGGKIWAESTLGQGSAFYFTLPINNTEL